MSVVLENPNHPEYGVATIPFPTPKEEYDHCIELLEALEIGGAVKADGKIISIDSYLLSPSGKQNSVQAFRLHAAPDRYEGAEV